MSEFYRKIRSAEIRKSKDAPREVGVRLYCSFSGRGGEWTMQVRAPMMNADRTEGKDFIIASAHLSREVLTDLRDAIDVELKRIPRER